MIDIQTFLRVDYLLYTHPSEILQIRKNDCFKKADKYH